MNKFEQLDNKWYWRGEAGLIEAEAPAIMGQHDFQRFIADEENSLARAFFKFSSCSSIYHSDEDDLYVPYDSTLMHAITAYIQINMRTGAKIIVYEFDQMLRTQSQYDEWGYFDVCDRIRAQEILAAENAHLRAENVRLREENTELKFRPGGPGYDETAAHFAALVLE